MRKGVFADATFSPAGDESASTAGFALELEARVGFEPTNGGFAVRFGDAARMGTVVNLAENTAVCDATFRSVPRCAGKFM